MLDTGRSGRLLVVEIDTASAMSAALEEGGYLVDTTPDTAEALSRIRAGDTHYDAIVVAAAPGKAGTNVAVALRALHPDLPRLPRADTGATPLESCFPSARSTPRPGGVPKAVRPDKR